MTEDQIKVEKEKIDKMSQREMAHLWRFAPSGHPYFNRENRELVEHFDKKFKEKGGMTSAISKSIGWSL